MHQLDIAASSLHQTHSMADNLRYKLVSRGAVADEPGKATRTTGRNVCWSNKDPTNACFSAEDAPLPSSISPLHLPPQSPVHRFLLSLCPSLSSPSHCLPSAPSLRPLTPARNRPHIPLRNPHLPLPHLPNQILSTPLHPNRHNLHLAPNKILSRPILGGSKRPPPPPPPPNPIMLYRSQHCPLYFRTAKRAQRPR